LNASPQLTRNIERFTQYLTIVGLTALVVGGVGVANAVSAYVERRRSTLAILKAVGANGTRVFLIAGAEVLLLAALGIVIGLVLGAALPFGVASLAASALPITLDPHLYPEQIATGALYGFLTTLAFSLLPLGRVHDIPVAALFRDEVAPSRTFPRKRYLVGAFSSALLLAASIITLSYDSRIASFAVGGTLAAFLILRLVAIGIMAGVKRLPPVRRTEWRLALANIHRPGALTPSLIVSLGLGVTLLVTIGLVDVNIQRLLGRSLPEKAPSFFFVDVPKSDIADFREFLAQSAPEGKIGDVPMMRGRVLRVKNVAAEDVKVSEQSAWVLDGDRGITFADTLPEGSALTAGEWWPRNYSGPPLVSLEEGIATGLDLKLGDKITVGVLGRSIEATIANIRKVEWRSMGINFVMVFSPNTFAGAPNTHLMSLTLPKLSNVSTETALLLASARAFPAITAVRVKEALEAVNDLVGKLALAIRGASGVTLLASVLVLAGALGSGQRARIYDSVILKALGATRGRLLNSLLFEYGLLGLFAALFGVIAGTGASYLVVRNIMNFEYAFDAGVALLVAVTAIIATIIIGLIGTWTVLGQKPARHLRAQ
jgi:putative ABC transport system permease protein